MGTFLITGPDGKKYRVTGETAEGALAALRKSQTDFRGEGGGRGTGLEAALIGARQGVTFGFGDEINAGVRAGMDWLGGRPFGEAYDERLEHERGLLDQTRRENPGTSFAGEVGGAIAPTLLSGGGAAAISAGQAARTGALGAGAYAFGEGEDGPISRVRDALLAAPVGAAGAAATAGLVNSIAARAAKKGVIQGTPSVDELKAAGKASYKAAEDSGVKASRGLTGRLASEMRSIADNANLIEPDGKIASKYTSISDALRVVDKYAGGTMTPGQMQIVRESFQEAAKQPGREGTIGAKMLEKFNEFTGAVAPQLREGDALWSKAMKGKAIEQATELAASQAGTYSGAGFENALRQQFKAMDRQIIKGELKGLSQAEIDAIRKVARGGPIENALRWMGRAAPTGPVAIGNAGILPAVLGTTMFDPLTGGLIGAGTMAAGAGARAGATALQTRNAQYAGALARGGSPIEPSPAVQQVIEALIAAQRPVASLPGR